MVRVEQGIGNRESGIEGGSGDSTDCASRAVRSGSAAAKEVKSWVPRT